ncbi:MAG: hypothetical protein WAT39_12220 [Planctomycetota bacterium]
MKHAALVVLFAVAAPALGQQPLHTHVLPPLWWVQRLGAACNANGDGRADFVVLATGPACGERRTRPKTSE